MDEKRAKEEVNHFFKSKWDTLKSDIFLVVKTYANVMKIEEAYGELLKKEFKPALNFPDFTPYICIAYNKTGYNMYIGKERFDDISTEDIFEQAYKNTKEIDYEVQIFSDSMAMIQHQFSNAHFLYQPNQILQILEENDIELPTIFGVPTVYDISVLIGNDIEKKMKKGIPCDDLISYSQFIYEEQPQFFVTPELYYINKQGKIKNIFETEVGLIVYDPDKTE